MVTFAPYFNTEIPLTNNKMLHKPISSQSKAWLLYACLLTLFAGCSKCNKVVEPDKTSTASLPAATQTGAGTFGCMLNGQAWLPVKDNTPFARANPNLTYDATWQGGTLAVNGEIYADKRSKESIGILSKNINSIGEYSITSKDYTNSDYRRFMYYSEQEEFWTDDTPNSIGKLTITKLDQVNRIIAGTFSFTITKNGKTINVTDGRFDMKYL